MKKLLLIITAFSFVMALMPATSIAQDYVGSTTCMSCHSAMHGDLVDNYEVSGHPYKLNPVDGGPPVYPENTSPGVTVTPPGTTWDDFSYVIGGYGWKARWVKKDGRIFTMGDSAQFNFETQGWVAYKKDQDKKYDYTCFPCHTTGGTSEGSWNGVPEDSLGTFSEPGIRCEGCHGPGSAHVSNTSTALPNTGEDLTLNVCADCHQRGGTTNAIIASGGYIKHHEQINEMRASKHLDGMGAELTCGTCHNAHVPLTYPDAAMHDMEAITKNCQDCHADKEILVDGTPKSIDCVACHMPPASKTAVGMQVGNGWRGDIKTHIWAINTDAVTKEAMFNEAGNLVELDENGYAAVTMDFACLRCHTSNDVAWASSYAVDIHTNGITSVVDKDYVPASFELSQNYPNPFNPTTTIAFTLPTSAQVTLDIYSIDGRLVASLVDDRMPAGSHTVKFDASNLASGLYMYRIQAGSFNASKKMVVLK